MITPERSSELDAKRSNCQSILIPRLSAIRSAAHLVLVLLLDAVAARAQVGARRHKVHVKVRVVVLLELGRAQAVPGERRRHRQRGGHLAAEKRGRWRAVEGDKYPDKVRRESQGMNHHVKNPQHVVTQHVKYSSHEQPMRYGHVTHTSQTRTRPTQKMDELH